MSQNEVYRQALVLDVFHTKVLNRPEYMPPSHFSLLECHLYPDYTSNQGKAK